MKTTYIIIAALVVIVIILGGAFAYISISAPTKPTPTPTAAPTATPTAAPIPTPEVILETPAPTATSIPSPTPYPTGTINGGGGTLVYPLMTIWQGDFAAVEPQITVNYNPEGSTGGITDFTNGVVNFGETDAPMTAAQYAALPTGTTAITIPITASAVVPAYNLGEGSSTPALNFTGAILADIFMGTITNWNDARLAVINPGTTLPNLAITCVHRSDGSGTMFAFTDFLCDTSSAWLAATGGPSTSASVWPKLTGELEGAKNAGVAADIASVTGAIGPLEISYINENTGQTNVYAGTVQNAAGNYITATVTSIAATLEAGASAVPLPAGNATWTSVSIVDDTYKDTTDTGIYPIVTMTYALVYEQQGSLSQGADTLAFLSWIVNDGQNLGNGLGYVPLPASIVAVDNASLKLVTYDGTPII